MFFHYEKPPFGWFPRAAWCSITPFPFPPMELLPPLRPFADTCLASNVQAQAFVSVF